MESENMGQIANQMVVDAFYRLKGKIKEKQKNKENIKKQDKK